ncbi:MAG: PEP-CTERM sorting domain-containing protein [Planctomycetota bacterium]
MCYSSLLPNKLALVMTIALLATTNANAQVGTYSQDFNSLLQSDEAALGDDGWLVSGIVLDDFEIFKFFYGNFAAPNTGPVDGTDFLEWQRDDGTAVGLAGVLDTYGQLIGSAFSNLTVGQGQDGPADQYLNTFSDYNCCGDNDGHPTGTDIVRSNILRETIIASEDIGRTVDFTFDITLPSGDLSDLALGSSGNSTGELFIRTISPAPDFATSAEVIVPISALGLTAGTWSTHTLSFEITSDLEGHFFQYGITNISTNFAPTGVYLDNVSLQDQVPSISAVPEPTAAVLVLTGLASLGSITRRRR